MSNLPPPEPMIQAESEPPQKKKKTLTEKEANDLVARWNMNFGKCATARTQFEKDWYYQMAFYFGRQWIEWVGTDSANFDFMRLYEPPAPRWRVRLIVNKIRPAVRKELTKLTKENVEYYVMPRTADDSDLAAARAAEDIAEYLFDEVKFSFQRRRATLWALLCGTSFMKDYYNPYTVDSQGLPGKICVEAVDAFHIYVPELQEEDLENQPFVIHAIAKSTDYVETTYGVKASPDVRAAGTALEQKFFSALGVSKQPTTDLCFVKEAWVKPCKDHPEGALITWTNEKLLSYSEVWPMPYTEFPFAKIDHIPTGRFYAESVIKDLIPIQKELNRTRSQLVEAKNRMAKPQLLAAKGSVDPQKITSEPGLIILYTPGFQPPTPIPLTQMPQYVIDEVARCQQDMDDIAGQYEVSKGRTPPGVEAASAIAYLQEENDTRLYHTVASIEEAVTKVGRHLLSMVDTFWDIPRLISVTGVDRAFEAQEYSNQDIRGNTNFKVEAQSAAPRSRAAKQAFLTELGKLGWLPPDKVLKYLDMTDTKRLYDEMQVSVRQAQRENVRMSQGMQMPIHDWDDDQIHSEEHAQYMRSQEFEILPPEIQQIHMLHLASHRQRMQMSMGMGMGNAPNPQLQNSGNVPVGSPSPMNGNEYE